MRLLQAGLLLVLGCSSSSTSPGASDAGGAGGAGMAGSFAVGGAAAGVSAGGAGSHAGVTSGGGGSGGSAGESTVGGTGGSGISGDTAGGTATTDGGAGGADESTAGAGGDPLSSGGSVAGSGGSGLSGGGAGGTAGTASGGQAGVSGTAGTGGTGVPDDCEGVPHWSATETWHDYEAGDRRVFGGRAWTCLNPYFCYSYPGSTDSWAKSNVCAGGLTDEVAACQCQQGTCCDGCYYRAPTYLCDSDVIRESCMGNVVPACGAAKQYIYHDHYKMFCGGDSVECTRLGTKFKSTSDACDPGSGCVAVAGDQASCHACN